MPAHQRRLAIALLLIGVWGSVNSCGDRTAPAASDRDDSGEVSFSFRLSKLAVATMSRAEVVITGADMAEIRQELTISGDTVSGTVRGVPAGTDRVFTINGYDAAGDVVYTGAATAEVVAGQQVTVRIVLRRTSIVGKPELKLQPSIHVERSFGTTITGEVTNSGTADATGVVIRFRARDSKGAAIEDVTVNVETVLMGESKLFEARFGSRFVSSADYTIAYNEGTAVTGTITVQ